MFIRQSNMESRVPACWAGTLLTITVVVLALAGNASTTLAGSHKEARRVAQWYTWHGRHYHVEWGTPVALVVPPTASLETNWGWGVGNTRISRINHQFARPYPTWGYQPFRPTPPWPSDTTQFGVHYVRGPW